MNMKTRSQHAIAIPAEMRQSWQRIVDLLAKVIGVPSAVITRVYPPYIEVIKTSASLGNPYHEGLRAELAGHYCEAVIKSKNRLLLPNAHKSEQWMNAPEIKYNMISYLGYPIHWPDGELFGTICVLDSKENNYAGTDQELMLQFQSLVELNLRTLWESNELRDLNAAKDKMFSIISHDLRGPFISLAGLCDLLHKQVDSLSREEIRDIASGLHGSTRKLSSLLENLLHWARLQSGQIHKNPKRINLHCIINAAIELLSGPTEQKHLSVSNQVPEALTAFADENMIYAVLRNLIGNAIKFTGRGGQIEVSAVPSSSFVTIRVRDDGVGMSAEDIAHVMDAGRLHSSSGTQGEPGFGLGLVLCKGLIEENGGALSIESIPDGGTEICVTLPRQAPEERTITEVNPQRATPPSVRETHS